MKNHQKQVIDNTSLVGFIGSRPHFPASATGFGVTGYGKLGFGEPRWAKATTRPVIPDCDAKVIRNSQPIRSLRNIRPMDKPDKGPQPQTIVCVCGNGFDKDEHAVKVAEKIRQVSMRMDNFVKDKVLSKSEPSLEGVVVNKKERAFKPAIVGLDKVRKVKRETVPAWEREKQERSDLILYALTLRSIYRLIYGG